MRKATSRLFSTVTLISLLAPACLPAETDFGQVAMHVAYMLRNQHYTRQDFDDAVSKKVLNSYLNFLDFNHIYFTQQDVDEFKADYETTLDDHVLMRNITPALEIYKRYKERVKQRVTFAQKVLQAQDFTFDSNRTLEIKREKSPWPKDEATSDKLWIDLIEGDLLAEYLSDKTRLGPSNKEVDVKASKDGTPQFADRDPGKDRVKSEKADETEGSPEKRLAKHYERLLKQLSENDQEDVVNYFLSCLATSYDPHTEYMSQQESDDFMIQMSHALVGIGALLSTKDKITEIQGIVVGGPADKQGELNVGDKILAVSQGDGPESQWVDIKYMKLHKVVELIRGKSGSLVRLKINPAAAGDASEINVISVVRGEVELKEKLANAELLFTPHPAGGKSKKLGWITLPSFYADMEGGKVSCAADVARLLKRLMAEKIEGLVIDLRGDGGGSLGEAIKLTGLFVPKGPVVQAKDWTGKITWRDCENERAVYDGPLIVLTDKASASASEIFAAALQDYHRAIIVGEKSTFGKGTVQQILGVDDYMPAYLDRTRAGALKVTTQKFYRIAGGSTQLKGVVPDIILPSSRDFMEIGEESLPNALPYDTIPPRPFNYATKLPLPLSELNARVRERVDSNPEFQYLIEDSKRGKERIGKDTISLNAKQRQKELDESKARLEARNKERKTRIQSAPVKSKDGFIRYRLTLDNVDLPELVMESSFTKEQTTGMREAVVADDHNPESGSQFPFGVENTKLEALYILNDLVELSQETPQTARTGDSKSTEGKGEIQ